MDDEDVKAWTFIVIVLAAFILVGYGIGYWRFENSGEIEKVKKEMSQIVIENNNLKIENQSLHKPEGDLTKQLFDERAEYAKITHNLRHEIDDLKVNQTPKEFQALKEKFEQIDEKIERLQSQFNGISMGGEKCRCHK